MEDTAKEKRKFPRTCFSGENGLSAIFKLPEPYNESAEGIVRDLSLGGMGFSLKKDYPMLNKDQVIILSEILNRPSLSFMKDIEMEIRWICLDPAEEFSLGCEFVNFPDDIAEQLRKVMASWTIRVI